MRRIIDTRLIPVAGLLLGAALIGCTPNAETTPQPAAPSAAPSAAPASPSQAPPQASPTGGKPGY